MNWWHGEEELPNHFPRLETRHQRLERKQNYLSLSESYTKRLLLISVLAFPISSAKYIKYISTSTRAFIVAMEELNARKS